MARETHEERDEFGRLRQAGDRDSSHRQQDQNRRHDDKYHHDRRNRDDDRDRHRSDDHSSSWRHDDHPPLAPPQFGTGADEYYGPAHGVEDTLPPGTVVQGTISRLEMYGAFLDFNDPKTGEPLRGLIHISQMSSQGRIDQVSDVVKQNQTMYAVVLDVEHGGRQRRIRLSLKDVDQDSGNYRGPSLGGSSSRGGGGGGGGRPPPPRELERRARQRRDLYLGFEVDWKKGSKDAWNQRGAPSYLRQLWSASPEPPSQTKASSTTDKKKVAPSRKKQAEPSSSSSASESSSNDDSSSEDDRRRSKTRKRSSRSNKRGNTSRGDRRRKRKGYHGRRRGRDDTSSSEDSSSEESSSSTSTSSSSSSTSSSSSSDSREKKRARRSSASEEKKHENSDDAHLVAGHTDDPEWKEAQALKDAVQGKHKQDNESGEEGPMPLPLSNAAGGNANKSGSAYGKALLPGEGQAIAQYVQNNLRIPRRGEIGYSGDDIERFEKTGYVMSGSRHQRMNAVRIRKENQVYSAEEQRALALITMEENQQKEAQLMEDFRAMLKEKQKLREKEQKMREKGKT